MMLSKNSINLPGKSTFPVISEFFTTVPASTKHLTELRSFVRDKAEMVGFSETDIAEIRLAVDEASTNIIKHAYNRDNSQVIQVKVVLKSNEFIVSLFDSGRRFNPQAYSLDLSERIKRKKRGGMGIYLINKLMDNVEYRHVKSVNELCMTKFKH